MIKNKIDFDSKFHKLVALIEDDSVQEVLLTGPAGSGKTTMISNLVKYLTESNSFKITLSTISNKALSVLKNSILKNEFDDVFDFNFVMYKTLSSLLGKVLMYDENGNPFYTDKKTFKVKKYYGKKKHLLIIDEYSMIDNDVYSDIKKFAKNNDMKLLFVGDKYQCPPPSGKECNFDLNIPNKVNLKYPLRYGGSLINLSELLKQAIDLNMKESELKKKIIELEKSNIDDKLYIYNDKKEFIDDATSYFLLNNSCIILAYRNKTVNSINSYIKKAVNKILNKENDVNNISVGDILIIDSRSNGSSVYVSESYKVLNSYNQKISFYIKKDKKIVLNPPYSSVQPSLSEIYDSKILNHIRYSVLEMASGDIKTIDVIPSDYEEEYNYIRSNYLKYAGKTMYYNNDNTFVNFFLNPYDKVLHGFASNIYKSQGSTYERIYIYWDDIMSIKPLSLNEKYKALYTAVTRAKNNVSILF